MTMLDNAFSVGLRKINALLYCMYMPPFHTLPVTIREDTSEEKLSGCTKVLTGWCVTIVKGYTCPKTMGLMLVRCHMLTKNS